MKGTREIGAARARLDELQTQNEAAWQNAVVLFKRRRLVISQMIELTAKRMSPQEDTLFRRITGLLFDLQSRSTVTQLSSMENRLESEVLQFLVCAEFNPNLGEDQEFMRLVRMYNDLRRQLNDSCAYFNQMIERYNTAIVSVEHVEAANLMNLKPLYRFEFRTVESALAIRLNPDGRIWWMAYYSQHGDFIAADVSYARDSNEIRVHEYEPEHGGADDWMSIDFVTNPDVRWAFNLPSADPQERRHLLSHHYPTACIMVVQQPN